jgi:hypothetical protein
VNTNVVTFLYHFCKPSISDLKTGNPNGFRLNFFALFEIFWVYMIRQTVWTHVNSAGIISPRCCVTQGPFPLKKNFHGQKIFRKYNCSKVENFQLQNFFPTKNLCRPITFYRIFFLRKIFLSANELLVSVSFEDSFYTAIHASTSPCDSNS